MAKLSANAQRALEDVRERLASGNVGPLVQMAVIARQPGDDKPSDHWSFNNRLLVLLQTYFHPGGPPTLDCRGFQQWKEVGRWVRKREKGAPSDAIYILRPQKFYERENGEFVLDENGERIVTGIRFWGQDVYPVWATEGEELPVFPQIISTPLHKGDEESLF